MAENRARHAFGALENIDQALSVGKIDSYDILFVKDANGKPYVGWIDKDGNKVICDDSAEFAELLEKIATKVDANEVDAKITEALNGLEFETTVTMDYVISHKPEGTIVDYRDKEIRILIPTGVKLELQNSGEGADANSYYIGMKAYAHEGAVSFKEDLAKTISDEEMYYFENNDFAGEDENGKYSIVWLPVAKYENDVWTYYGATSSEDHYIGWYYSVEWYDANGMMIGSDCIRVNLSNENCHSVVEPYYVNEVKTEVEAMVDKKIAETSSVYEIVEF